MLIAREGTWSLAEGLSLMALAVVGVLALVFSVMAIQHVRARRAACAGAVVATTATIQSVSGRLELVGDSLHWHPPGRASRRAAEPISLHLVDLADARITRGRWSAALEVRLAEDGRAELAINPLGAQRFADTLSSRAVVRTEPAPPARVWLAPAIVAVLVLETVAAFQFIDPGQFDPVAQLPTQRPATALPDEMYLGNPPGSDTVISTADATKVVLAAREAQLDAIEARQIAEIEATTSRFARWQGVASAVVGKPLLRATGVRVHDVLVPSGRGYPAVFLAELTWTHSAGVSSRLQVFERTDESSPWRVALSTGYEGTPLPLTDDSMSGTASAPRSLHDTLADYFRSWKETGQPPPDTRVAPGPFTTAVGSRLAATPQDGDYGRGILMHVEFHAGDIAWAFNIPDGHLECGAVWHVSDYDSARQVRDRSNWGNALAPGHYDWIREADLWMSCVLATQDGTLIEYGADGARAIVRASDDHGIERHIAEISQIVTGIDDPPYWR